MIIGKSYRRTIPGLAVILVIVLSFSLNPVFAKDESSADSRIPEKNGVYDDPGHPGVKVRVFVHPEKLEKATSSILVCNLADPDSSATIGAANWHLPSNWTYNLNPSSVPSSVGLGNLATIAGNGFSDWTSAINNKVTFSQGANTTVSRSSYDGKNIIAWGRTSGDSLGVTYVRYYVSSGLVVDVDTIMNKRVFWSWSNSSSCADSNTYDAENILTHELGHWIGLDDEYDLEDQNATMYGYGSKGEVKKNTLTVGDISGAASIYH